MWNRNSFGPSSGRESSRSSSDARMPSRYNTPVTRAEDIRTRDYRNSNERSGFERTNRFPQSSPQIDRREAPSVQYRESIRRPESYTPSQAAPQRSSGFRGRERSAPPQPQVRPEPRPQAAPPSSPPGRGNGPSRGEDRGEGRRGLRSLGNA
jgi:hypothetical protein